MCIYIYTYMYAHISGGLEVLRVRAQLKEEVEAVDDPEDDRRTCES